MAAVHVKECCKHPGQAYSGKHTRNTDIGKVQIEKTVVYEPEKDQHKAPAEHFLQQCHFASFLYASSGREGECHSSDEKKEWEYGVMVRNAIPFYMFHLHSDKTVPAFRKKATDCRHQPSEAHDEHHVKTSQDIDGQ